MSDYIYFINGEFVPAGAAGVGLNDLGLVRGYAVFDLLRTYGAEEGQRRLAASGAFAHILAESPDAAASLLVAGIPVLHR